MYCYLLSTQDQGCAIVYTKLYLRSDIVLAIFPWKLDIDHVTVGFIYNS